MSDDAFRRAFIQIEGGEYPKVSESFSERLDRQIGEDAEAQRNEVVLYLTREQAEWVIKGLAFALSEFPESWVEQIAGLQEVRDLITTAMREKGVV